MAGLRSKSLERIVPDELDAAGATGTETLAIHLERYEFAAARLTSGRVLDLACGVGYGTRLLADRNAGRVQVLGVDREPEAIAYAKRRYAGESVSFEVADAMKFVSKQAFDAIVSLETIEHLPEPERFMDRLVRMLRPNGMLLASVPVTPSVDINVHHLHDFDERSFRAIGRRHGLQEVDRLVQIQQVALGPILRRSESRLSDLRPNLVAWYARHPGALLRRIGSTLRYGLVNRYLTVAWRKPST